MSIKVKGIPIRNEELSYDVEIPFSNLTVEGQERMFLNNKDVFICEAFASKYDTVRQLARGNMSDCSSATLNEALKFLFIGRTVVNCDLILEILAIPNLILDDDVRVSLSTSDYWPLRQWVAKDTNTPLDLLYKMLIPAVQSVFWHHDFVVFNALVYNPNFKMSEELQDIVTSIYDIEEECPEIFNKSSVLSKTISNIKEILSNY